MTLPRSARTSAPSAVGASPRRRLVYVVAAVVVAGGLAGGLSATLGGAGPNVNPQRQQIVDQAMTQVQQAFGGDRILKATLDGALLTVDVKSDEPVNGVVGPIEGSSSLTSRTSSSEQPVTKASRRSTSAAGAQPPFRHFAAAAAPDRRVRHPGRHDTRQRHGCLRTHGPVAPRVLRHPPDDVRSDELRRRRGGHPERALGRRSRRQGVAGPRCRHRGRRPERRACDRRWLGAWHGGGRRGVCPSRPRTPLVRSGSAARRLRRG